MTKFDKTAKRIDSFRDEMINLQIQLCAVPAISPSSGGEGEVRKAEVLHAFLEQLKFDDIELIKAPDLDAPCGYRPNILAVLKYLRLIDGMSLEEHHGLTLASVLTALAQYFNLQVRQTFQFGLNNLLVYQRRNEPL